jgi:hypothetical protein
VSKRKMLAAEEDLANRVAQLAEKRGLTVYQTVNDILEQAIRAEDSGLSLKDAVDRRRDMDLAREMGLTFTVEHLYYQVVDLAYKQDKRKVMDLWQEMGLWYGKYFKGKGNDAIKSLTEALNYLTRGSQFTMERGKGDELTVSCISERYSRGYTEAFAAFITSAFNVLGYKVLENEAHQGIIRLRLSKE